MSRKDDWHGIAHHFIAAFLYAFLMSCSFAWGSQDIRNCEFHLNTYNTHDHRAPDVRSR